VYKATDAPIVQTKAQFEELKSPILRQAQVPLQVLSFKSHNFIKACCSCHQWEGTSASCPSSTMAFENLGRVVRSQLYINKFVPESCWMLRDGYVSLFSKFGKNPDHEFASSISDGCVLGKSNMAVKSFRIHSPRASSHRMH
jgi:hypothetical protein